MAKASTATPFKVSVGDDTLNDLAQRIASSRFPPNEIDPGAIDPSNGAWSRGASMAAVKHLSAYWKDEFLPRWREVHEKRLNALPQFLVDVDGVSMHFIHARSASPAAIPLLLVHGWPGSVVEFLELIPLLTNGKKSFHVVAPSIPGYAWSEAPSQPGADAEWMAEKMHSLMLSLGYVHYAAQGGDWGSIITKQCALKHPQHCVALHLNMFVPAVPRRHIYGAVKALALLLLKPFIFSSSQNKDIDDSFHFFKYESAYQATQGTKPQSLGYGLNDSPIGLLAWILEKFQTWSDVGFMGNADHTSWSTDVKDKFLTNLTVYWVTQTITSSVRIYYDEMGHSPLYKGARTPLALPDKHLAPVEYCAVPTGFIAANDLFKFPKAFAQLTHNVQHWTSPSTGGHFLALEQPVTMAKDLSLFFHDVIDFGECIRTAPLPGGSPPWTAEAAAFYAALFAAVASGVRACL